MPRFSRTVAHRESGFPEAGLRASALPSQSRLTPCQLPRRGSRVSSPPEACRRPSLASPFGGGGLALARTERAARQRLAEGQVSPPPLGGAGAQWAPFSAWSPLPRRSVMDAAHWAASPEPAGESAPAGGGEGSPPAPPPQNNPSLPGLTARPCRIIILLPGGVVCWACPAAMSTHWRTPGIA